ncbi:MAG: helix-hairpin-helix domain-containing protein [Bacteroidales bacterium]|nr:helix-hairpin-helix domain-containing protein [Bacteroidales bacterium]
MANYTPHRIILVLLGGLLNLQGLYAQNVSNSTQSFQSEIIDKIEILASTVDREIDYTELIEDLKYFAENPLNLNSATYNELLKLGFLNDMQIYHLMAYRETYGYLVSMYELQAIEGFDESIINSMLLFVAIAPVAEKPKLKFSNIAKYGKHKAIIRYQRLLQEKEGYKSISDSLLYSSPNSVYTGNADKIYFRYGFNYSNRIRFGITMEKDPGEIFFRSNLNDSIRKLINGKIKSGFDFYSGHITVNDIGRIKALTIGDYQLRFGQGLTMWSGLAFGKSADVLNVKKNKSGVKPYTSSDENRYFRGVASTLNFGRVDLTAFYSSQLIDANLMEKDTGIFTEFEASMVETGYHRTVNEILKKDALKLMVTGGNLKFSGKRFQIGLTGVYSRLNYPIAEKHQLYNKFVFNNFENINAGMDYSFLFWKFQVFGEFSLSENGGIAQLYGISANLHPRISASLLYRNYERGYQNYFSNPFAESNPYNESGIYTGLRLLLLRHLSLSVYIDQYKYPWLRYSVNQPSIGNEVLAQIDYKPNREVSMNFRFKSKVRQKNQAGAVDYSMLVLNHYQSAFRYHIDYIVSQSLSMRNRLEFLVNRNNTGEKSTGYLVYHDVKWKSPDTKLNIFFRYALFDTDSYDDRIYAYENDLLYAFSVPAYYYKGSKGIIMLKYRLKNYLDFWLRFSHLWVKDHKSLGSGPDLINDNKKSEIKIQIQLKL